MRAGLFIAAIPISASAQTREQVAPTQAQIAARQARNNADPAISQRDALQAQLQNETLAVKVPERGGAQHDEAPAVTPAAPRPKGLGWHGYRPRLPARPQPTFWQRLFGQKETKKAKPGKPRQ